MNDLVKLEYNFLVRDIKNYLKTLEQYGIDSLCLPPGKSGAKKDSPEVLNKEIENCCFCKRDNKAPRFVFNEYPEDIKVLFLVDMPKTPEYGRVFSRDERILFSNILKAMKLNVSEVFVLPVIRCRLMPDEFSELKNNFPSGNCYNYLLRSLKFINPGLVCFLGKELKKFFPDSDFSLRDENELFLKKHRFFSTYSINDMIIDPGLKKDSWAVFQQIMGVLEEK